MKGNIVTHYLFFALTDATLGGKARRLAETALKAPVYAALNRLDRRLMNEELYRSYRGLSEDRVRALSQELFDRVVKPGIFPGARELVAADRAAGYVTAIVTGALDVVAEPLARHLGIERVHANRLAFDADGVATGELEPPVLAGPEKAAFLRKLARAEGLDLERSRAYANDAPDVPFLSAVGRPVAVNPDASLRATARAHGWPVLELKPVREGPHAREPRKILDRAVDGALTVLRLLEKSKK